MIFKFGILCLLSILCSFQVKRSSCTKAQMDANQSLPKLESHWTARPGLGSLFVSTISSNSSFSFWVILALFLLILGVSVFSQKQKEIEDGYPVLGNGSYWRRRTGTTDMNRDCLKLLREGYRKVSILFYGACLSIMSNKFFTVQQIRQDMGDLGAQ